MTTPTLGFSSRLYSVTLYFMDGFCNTQMHNFSVVRDRACLPKLCFFYFFLVRALEKLFIRLEIALSLREKYKRPLHA